MKLIGITGGIGTGKSTVVEILRKRGWTVYASDQTAKEIMASDDTARAELSASFGKDVLTTSGVDAKLLASKVFGPTPEHHANLMKLNQIIHPRVLDAHIQTIETERTLGSPLVAIESALLYEVELEDGFDWVVVVNAQDDTCVQRVMTRSGTSETEVRRRMAEQMPIEEKRGLADFVIENDGSLKDLEGATALVAMILESFPDPETEEAE
ncbi:MAG: dephospho-CoA kinase [Candidatus Kapabacteria bacterium]|nr:dephospho-CoA kinase [Candidatus Kapabacteria bacterium]